MKEKKQQKRKKKKGWDPLSLTVLLIALCVFVFSAYQLAMMMVPYYTGGEEYDEIKNLAIVSDKIGEGVDRNSKIVSLSTCTNVNDDERFLLQGVLIKEE